MSQLAQPLQHKMYGRDANVIAVTEMDAFKRGVLVAEGKDGVVR